MIKKDIKNRVIFSVILLSLFVPAFVMGGMNGVGYKTTSMAIYSLAGMLVFYELLTALKINKYISIVSTVIVPLFIVTPISAFKFIINQDGGPDINFIADSAMNKPIIWLILILFSILPLLFQSIFSKVDNYWKKQIVISVVLPIITVFANLFFAYNSKSFKFVMFFMLISIISDTFGYFGGMLFGKKMFKGKKLAPSISPNKTWAGFVIGTSFSVLFATIAGYYLGIWKPMNNMELPFALVMGYILPLVAVAGDLFFSFIKRNIGIKDFSNLLPGHGGFLDRLDSLSFVIFFSGIMYLFMT